MANLDPEQLQALFLELTEIPANDREQWFNERSIDKEIRDEVLELLRYHDETGLPIDQDPLQGLNADSDSNETETTLFSTRSRSQVIGPYKLLQKIGEGGMGQV